MFASAILPGRPKQSGIFKYIFVRPPEKAPYLFYKLGFALKITAVNQDSLTILTLFSGVPSLLKPFFDAFKCLEKPASTKFVAVNNSPDENFARQLAAFGCAPLRFSETLPVFPGSPVSREAQILKAEHCARLYHFAKPFVKSENILIWEHDVLPRPGALKKLFETREKTRADFVSASVTSRITAQSLAWRLKKGLPENGFKRVWVSRQAKRVQATGFGFLLMPGRLFQELPLEAARPGYPFWGCDLHAGAWAHQRGYRWFIDGTVRCQHVCADGQPARRGRLENVLAGSYLDFQKTARGRPGLSIP